MNTAVNPAAMAAAAGKYGLPKGSAFEDGVSVGPFAPSGTVLYETPQQGMSLAGQYEFVINAAYSQVWTPANAPTNALFTLAISPAAGAGAKVAIPVTAAALPVWARTTSSRSLSLPDGRTIQTGSGFHLDQARTLQYGIGAAVANGNNITFTVVGTDVYGLPMMESVTVNGRAANVVTVGRKAFSSVYAAWFSSNLGFNDGDAVAFNIGVANGFGLPYWTPGVATPLISPYQTAAVQQQQYTLVPGIPSPTIPSSAAVVPAGASVEDVRGLIQVPALVPNTLVINASFILYAPGFSSFSRNAAKMGERLGYTATVGGNTGVGYVVAPEILQFISRELYERQGFPYFDQVTVANNVATFTRDPSKPYPIFPVQVSQFGAEQGWDTALGQLWQ